MRPNNQIGLSHFLRITIIVLQFLLWFASVSAQSYVSVKNSAKIRVAPIVPLKAYAFDLRDVTLLDGSPFRNAMEKDASYLLSLEPDRLLHRFYKNAGLPAKGEVYGEWESEGLSGHTMGHYLSACAMMYAGTRNAEFKRRVDYIIEELEQCQIARKSGYIGAIPKEDTIFTSVAHGKIRSSGLRKTQVESGIFLNLFVMVKAVNVPDFG